MAATLTISAGVVDSLTSNPSSVIGYSSTKNIVINGDITHTQASALKGVASPSITATVEQTTVANLKAITTLSGRTNAFKFTTSDSTASASDLNAVKALTTTTPDFASVTAVSASSVSDIKSLYAGTNTSLGNETISVNDGTITAADLNAINAYSTGFVTSTATKITGTAAELTTVEAASGASGDKIKNTVLGFAVEINDAAVAADELDTLEGQYTGVINIASGSSVTGTFANVKKVYDHTQTDPATITGLSDKAITLGTTASPKTAVADINTASGYTSGVVTATVNETRLDTISGLTETGNNLTIDIATADGTAVKLAAATLKAVNDKTTGTITIDTAITDIDGAFADVSAVFNASSSEIVRIGDEKTTISDNISVSQVNGLIAKTTGLVTASITDGDMATLDGITLNTATGSETAHALTITVTDTSVDAAKLNALDVKTSAAKAAFVINSITVTGSLADVKTLYAAQNGTLTGLGNEAVTISDTTLAAADLKAVEAATSGDVTVTGTSVTGSVADVKTVFSKAGSGIVGLGNETVSLSDADVDAADLATINTATSGLVGFDSTVKEFSGTLTEAQAVVTAATKTFEADGTTVKFEPTIDPSALTKIFDISTGLTITEANTFAGTITGTVDAALATTGNEIKLDKLLAASGGLLGGHKIAITVDSDAGATAAKGIVASELTKLDNLTTGLITIGTTPDTLEGTAAEVAALYNSSGIAGKANKAHKISLLGTADIAAADLVTISNTVGGHTTGTSEQLSIAGSNVVGSSADLKAVYAAYLNSGGVANAGKLKFAAANPTATITGAVASAADIKAFDGQSTGVKILAAASLSGVTADIEAVFADAKTTGTADVDIVMTDTGGTTVANFKKVEDLTGANNITATIKETDVTTLKTLEAQNGIHTLTINIDDASVDASDLKTVNGKTAGLITLKNAVKTLTGTAADVAEAFTSFAAGTAMALESSTPSLAVVAAGKLSVSQVNSISGQTSGKITASVSDSSIALLEGITKSTDALTLVVKDTTVDAAKLSALTSK